jgi:hypothetical protein
MTPEAADAIRIADKHLLGMSPARREALAKDIMIAIIKHAGNIADDVLIKALAKSVTKQ